MHSLTTSSKESIFSSFFVFLKSPKYSLLKKLLTLHSVFIHTHSYTYAQTHWWWWWWWTTKTIEYRVCAIICVSRVCASTSHVRFAHKHTYATHTHRTTGKNVLISIHIHTLRTFYRSANWETGKRMHDRNDAFWLRCRKMTTAQK